MLVPLEPERGVWLTRRSALVPNHAGQVSFPGGKIEAYDASVEAAALREAAEEIGLDPAGTEILGRMDDFITGTGFHIAPVVALVPKKRALYRSPGRGGGGVLPPLRSTFGPQGAAPAPGALA